MTNKLKEFHDEVVAFMAGYNPAPATPKPVSVPVQSGTLTYSGAAKIPTWSGYDSTQLTLGGTTSATNAGTYTATFTLKDGYVWTDGTSNPKNATWTIAKATPTISRGNFNALDDYYHTFTLTITTPSDGALSVTSSDPSIATATISGKTVTVTDKALGNCTLTISQKDSANYTAATLTAPYTVYPSLPDITLNKDSAILAVGASTTFTVSTPSDGDLSVTSSNTEVATATISGKTITVKSISYGTVRIRVSQDTGSLHSANNIHFSVTCGATLITDSWATISTRAKNGTAGSYYKVGDMKEVTLNGNIGDGLTLENEKLYVYILHINYPMNGVADNNIIWGGFKTSSGKPVALCDAKYNKTLTDGTIYFNMNHWGNYNYGGWKGADFRYDVLGATSTQPSGYGSAKTTSCVGYNATAATLTSPKSNTLLAALPSDFRGALRLWSRWVDAKGNRSNVEANIEETIDAVTLLTEFEVKGAHSRANKYEQNHQTQMDYFKNGNNSISYRHDGKNPYDSCHAASASPCYANDTDFCYFGGPTGANDSSRALGVMPAFKV